MNKPVSILKSDKSSYLTTLQYSAVPVCRGKRTPVTRITSLFIEPYSTPSVSIFLSVLSWTASMNLDGSDSGTIIFLRVSLFSEKIKKVMMKDV